MNHTHSTPQSLHNGIAKGSPLSVILFLIAFNSVADIYEKYKNPKFTAYADDFNILTDKKRM